MIKASLQGIILKLASFILILVASYTHSYAHEVRPAYLKITETGENEYTLFWKVPTYQGKYINISPIIANENKKTQISQSEKPDALIREYSISTTSSLKGQFLKIENIEKTLIDVLVEIHFLNDVQYTTLLQPSKPRYLIPVEYSVLEVIKTYFILGVEHILIGYDHLLFVLGLFLIIPGVSKLIKTITAFTIAHSITLLLASLDLITVPSSPVEAIISISIVLLALEVIRKEKGLKSLTILYPWLVAFLFGLIHGLGFAGALSEIGLPQKSIATALLLFNVGVEVGQIIFLLVVGGILTLTGLKTNRTVMIALSYFIGITGMYWTIERIISF